MLSRTSLIALPRTGEVAFYTGNGPRRYLDAKTLADRSHPDERDRREAQPGGAPGRLAVPRSAAGLLELRFATDAGLAETRPAAGGDDVGLAADEWPGLI
jgi:hypothetical protein